MGIIVLLELPILTMLIASTSLLIALRGNHPIETLIPTIIRDVRMLNEAILVLRPWTAQAILQVIVLRLLFLTIQVGVLVDGAEEFETLPQIFVSNWVRLDHLYELVYI